MISFRLERDEISICAWQTGRSLAPGSVPQISYE